MPHRALRALKDARQIDARLFYRLTAAAHQMSEVRTYAAILTLVFVLLTIEPNFYMFYVPVSVLPKVAALAPFFWCVPGWFALCTLAAMPHLIALMFRPESLNVKWPRKFACYAAFGSAVGWLYLANLAVPMDLGSVEWAYLLRATIQIVIGLAYGASLNAQQAKERADAPIR